MKKLNFIVASLFAATLLATPACNKEDIEGPTPPPQPCDTCDGPEWIIKGYINDALGFYEHLCEARNYQAEESNFFAKKAAELFQVLKSQKTTKSYSPTDINSDDYSIGNFVYNTNSQYNITQEDTPLPSWEQTAYGGSYLNTQTEIVTFNGKTYLLVVMSKRGHQPGEYFGNTGGGEGFLKWGTLYESDIASHTTYSKTDEYVWLVHEIKLDTGAEILYPLIINNKSQRSYTNPIIITSKKGLVVSNWQYITEARSVYGTVCGTEVKCSSKNNDNYNLSNDLSCVGYCKTWSDSIFNIKLGSSGHAWDWFANRSYDSRFATYPNGSTEPPREGDIIAMHGKGSTGHVVVIYYVDYQNGKVYIAHQNGGKGKDCPPIGCALDLICENGTYTIKDNIIRSYIIDGWIRRRADPDHFKHPVVIDEEDLAISQCAINEEDIDKGDSREFTEGDDIKIVAWANATGKFTISVNGEPHDGTNYTIKKAQPGKYDVSVWIEADGKKSDEYTFTINVKEKEGQGEIPAITKCTINGSEMNKNACNSIDYNDNEEYLVKVTTNSGYQTKILFNKTVYDYPSDSYLPLNIGDNDISIWNERDGQKSKTYDFTINVKEKGGPINVIIESNIASGTYLPQIVEKSIIKFDYNNTTISLRDNQDLRVKYVYEGSKIYMIAEKKYGNFVADGVAMLCKNGFSSRVEKKNYSDGDKEVKFEIDPNSITDKTEYRIVLVTDFVAENGSQYNAGYFTAPLVLNSANGDASRTYSVSPNGSYVKDITSKDWLDIPANWGNRHPDYLVQGNANCEATVKVTGISGNKVNITCSKDEGFRSSGKIYVFEGTTPENLWYGNILGEKSYRGNNQDTKIDLSFEVSHITKSTKFCVVFLSDKPWEDDTYRGYYTGTITVSPR